MASQYKIANGHNNAAGLVSLDLLSPPLFRIFYDLLTEWHPYVLRELNGDMEYVEIGRPWVVWRFHVLTRAELLYLRTTFGKDVTLRTLNKTSNAFANYNARLLLPDPNSDARWNLNEWRDVKLEFRRMVAI